MARSAQEMLAKLLIVRSSRCYHSLQRGRIAYAEVLEMACTRTILRQARQAGTPYGGIPHYT